MSTGKENAAATADDNGVLDRLPQPPQWWRAGASGEKEQQPAPDAVSSGPDGAPPVEAHDDGEAADGSTTDDELGVRDLLRHVRRTLVGRDLIAPRGGLWPFGRAARERRRRRDEILTAAEDRRTALRQQFNGTTRRATARRPWRSVDHATNRRVIATWIAIIVVIAGLTWWIGDRGAEHNPPAPTNQPSADPLTTPRPSRPSTSPTSARTTSLPAVEPIPPRGVAPQSPAPASPPGNPADLVVATPPAGELSPEELGTPESAARAWLARWCAFDYTAPFAASEQRARPAMTDLGWRNFDPARDDRGRQSWERTVAAKESGRCSAPQAEVPSGAPASADRRIVLVWADRVVTSATGSPYVERIMQTRHVHQGADGRWRVDIATVGG